MVKQPVIRPSTVKRWKDVKSMGIADVVRIARADNKMSAAKISEADMAVAWKDMLALFRKFDEGLMPAIKKANSAADDASARAALQEVVRICTNYEHTLDQWRAKNPKVRGFVATAIRGNLHEVGQQAQLNLDAIPARPIPTNIA